MTKQKKDEAKCSEPAKNGSKCNWLPLKNWFAEEKRDLPWRNNPTPYQVWISEVMLQQTQVSVVIPYFERWMNRFPGVESLAKASIDEVIKLWEGLGYYSRARNIHAAAKYILETHQGVIPSSYEELKALKGLGPYTIGAIQSFAFKMKAPAVDGNVIRVLSRYFLIEDDISKGKSIEKMRQHLANHLPDDEPWIISEALIELGATLCQKKPRCSFCPLRVSCKAHSHGRAELLPIKSAKIKYEKLYRTVAVINHEDHFLVKKGEKGKIMSDLYEFPQTQADFAIKKVTELPKVNHSFTRFRVTLTPFLYVVEAKIPVAQHEWLSLKELKERPFSSGHKKILNGLLHKA